MSSVSSRRSLRLDRRAALSVACLACVGAACAPANSPADGGDASSDGSAPDVLTSEAAACGDGSAGPVAMFAIDTLTVVRSARVIIGRDAGGLFAVSAVCTHQGYDLSVQNQQIVCLNEPVESHGTVFDKDGRVTTGPAPSPLANLRVTVCDGRVFVGSELVPAGTRVAVG